MALQAADSYMIKDSCASTSAMAGSDTIFKFLYCDKSHFSFLKCLMITQYYLHGAPFGFLGLLIFCQSVLQCYLFI